MNSLLRGEIFKRKAELPPEPELPSGTQIYEDLSIINEDSLYTNDVTQIITTHNLPDMNYLKPESFNPKSFNTIDDILRAKKDIILQRKSLTGQIDNLYNYASDLKLIQQSMQNTLEKI